MNPTPQSPANAGASMASRWEPVWVYAPQPTNPALRAWQVMNCLVVRHPSRRDMAWVFCSVSSPACPSSESTVDIKKEVA